MPYIPLKRIHALHGDSSTDFYNSMHSKGELNFQITELLIEYIETRGLSYTVVSEAAGAARDAASELERRILGKYEDKMIKKNGDVYKSLVKLLGKIK